MTKHSRVVCILAALVTTAFLSTSTDAQTLQALAAPRSPGGDSGCGETSVQPTAAVFLSGAVTTADAKSAPTATSGALGISKLAPTYTFSTQINVASTTDTVRSGFGASLLTPGAGSALSAGLFDWRRPIGRFLRCEGWPAHVRGLFRDDRLKVRAYGTVSSSVWSLPAAGTGANEEPATDVNVVPVGFGLGLAYTLEEETLNGKPVSAGLVLGFSRRLIHGDIAGESHALQREAILGTSKESFSGFEAGLELQFGQITGGVTFYSFPRAATVPGFSRGQVVAGFSLRSNVLETDREAASAKKSEKPSGPQ